MELNRKFALLSLALLVAFPLFAAGPRTPEPDAARGHRHLVRTPLKDEASLSGRVTDAATGAAVFKAVVTVQGKSVTAATDGTFSFDGGLVPGATTITVSRWGYNDASNPVTLVVGGNTVNLTMQSKPPLRLKDATGATYNLEVETAHFAQRINFVGYHTLEPLEVCLVSGDHQSIATTDIKHVVGTGATTSNSVCCPDNPSPKLVFTLRDASTVDAIIENCKYYEVDFIARNYADGIWHYMLVTDIRDLLFP